MVWWGGGEDAVFMEAEQTGMQTLSPADLDALLAGVRAFQHILGLFFSFLFCVYKHVPVPLRQSIPAIAGVELASAESAPQVRHCLKQSAYSNKWIKLEQFEPVKERTSQPTKLTQVVDSAGGAIMAGLARYRAREVEQALELFERALTLPGSGVRRIKGSPRELTSGERQAALYNIACCQSVLGNDRDGLAAVAAALDAGCVAHDPKGAVVALYSLTSLPPPRFDDYKGLRSDPDLLNLRKNSQFEVLVSRAEPKGFAKLMMGGDNLLSDGPLGLFFGDNKKRGGQ